MVQRSLVCCGVAASICLLLASVAVNAAATSNKPPLSFAVNWTSVPADPIPAASLDTISLGRCICNLHANQCDPNCCCDSDCSISEREGGFTGCRRQTIGNRSLHMCSPDLPPMLQVIRQQDESIREEVMPGGDSVCLVRMNFPSDFGEYIQQPVVPLTSSDIEVPDMRLLDTYKLPENTAGFIFGDRVPLVQVYPSGLVRKKLSGFVPAPKPMGSKGECSRASTAKFMEPSEDNDCVRVGSLKDLCGSDGPLSIPYHSLWAVTPPGFTIANALAVKTRVVDAFTLQQKGSLIDATTIINSINGRLLQGAKRRVLQSDNQPSATITPEQPLPTSSDPSTTTNTTNTTDAPTTGEPTPAPPQTPAPTEPALPGATKFVLDELTNRGTCQDAVIGVRMKFKYEFAASLPGTITEAEMELHVADVHEDLLAGSQVYTGGQSEQSVLQFHSVKFSGTLESDRPARSGNPGYMSGRKVLVGTHVTAGSGKQAIQQRVGGMSVPSGGRCNVPTEIQHIPVKFLHNVESSGCSVEIDEEKLTKLCVVGNSTIPLIHEVLYGGSATSPAYARGSAYNTTAVPVNRVGRTADADYSDLGQWINIHGVGDVAGAAGAYDGFRQQCSDITVGYHWHFVVGRAGAIWNPQDVIVGAKVVPLKGTWAFRNDTHPLTGTSKVHLKFRVTFSRHLSQETMTDTIDPPPLLPAVDENVFYPFSLPTRRDPQHAPAAEGEEF